MKIFAIMKNNAHFEFYSTEDLARIQLHILADKYRKQYLFKLNKDSFSYEGDALPEDDGSNTRYLTIYAIIDIDVRE